MENDWKIITFYWKILGKFWIPLESNKKLSNWNWTKQKEKGNSNSKELELCGVMPAALPLTAPQVHDRGMRGRSRVEVGAANAATGN